MNYIPLENYELSNIDIQHILGKIPIIRYPDLIKYKSLNQALNNKFNAFVLFYETENSNVGHWCCCFRNPDNSISYFDSYGLSPLDDLDHISQQIRVKLKEITPYLPNLIKKAVQAGETVFINKNDYQSWKSDVSTCGKHSSVRLLNRNLNDKQYFNYLVSYMKQNNLPSFDDAVCDIIFKIIGK